MSALTRSPQWKALQAHAGDVQRARLLDLFERDRKRADDFSCEAAGLYLDYSKQRITRDTVRLLLELAEARDLPQAIEWLMSGEAVNLTEGRAALHTALRRVSGAPLHVSGRNVMPEVLAVQERVGRFAEAVRGGQWRGFKNEPITDVVNVGIGGSDLGPRMVCEALAPYASSLRVHFIANVDGAPLSDLFRRLKPQHTLFVVTSKTFTTQETMANANAARRWIVAAGGERAVERHFVAVSTNLKEVTKFGIRPEHTFEFWDWVGGRYSLWSSVGLAIVLAIGAPRFREMLAGASAMDEHFRSASLGQNLPVMMGLLGVWNTNFLRCVSHMVAPYSQRLEKFVPWLQQLEMESNGKSVDLEGHPVDYPTTPVLWGDVGTNAQHAFFQMVHQGPIMHPADFILVADGGHELGDQHRMLLANGLAQTSALMRGKSLARAREELSKKGFKGAELDGAVAHRVLPGNRPTNTLLVPRLDPYHLGALLALYEHRTYVQGVMWNINSFDQFGVELGKQAAERGLMALEGREPRGGGAERRLDPSTRKLIARLRARQN
ncbi:MAG TPA: glucose-6-phosphate isomerase [Candidatus Binatia bacterium]|nr:glucose-6-phosphate isomerase [Candidatus Binatia bacterium]